MSKKFSLAGDFKRAFVEGATVLFADEPVKVAFGHPGIEQPDEIVAFTKVASEQEPATLSTNRSRDETLTQTVVISVWREGGADQEQAASDRAYELLGALEEWARMTRTNVGGVLWCALTSHTSDGETSPQVLAAGRLVEVEATFTARARITS
ncbi:hypothetical protein QT381_02565 [Galbitalea sp. SE-J8]|uniref:hypothetical protein n=1 Tax=Galbitalea sp. SE-J8 TaxID=3054952 RepID=UPI00259C979E|nr:hypothetical protein [Galbitalea sp. SE-J8]MDM4761886.1 hypothetical protein [Galbitalea sp. SE-J8]